VGVIPFLSIPVLVKQKNKVHIDEEGHSRLTSGLHTLANMSTTTLEYSYTYPKKKKITFPERNLYLSAAPSHALSMGGVLYLCFSSGCLTSERPGTW
jgi:hypothetical protein